LISIGAGADVEVRFAHGVEHLLECDAVGAHGVGIDVHLVFANETADRRDLGDAVGRLQREANAPILEAAQFLQVPAAHGLAVGIASFEGIPEHLAHGGGVGAEGGLNAGGSRPGERLLSFSRMRVRAQ
jgi:hypothetical protein